MIRRGRTSLGAWLARWIAASTALSLAIFAAIAALILWVGEVTEDEESEAEEAREAAGGEAEEDPLAEALQQVGLALAIAAPIGILLAMLGARWLAERAVVRVDAVISTAARMTATNLSERLPVSPADDELDALAVALNTLFARLEEGVALQLRFAADASHELRSPLAVLSSTLEVARRRPRSTTEWEAVTDRALDEVHHMTRLVDALLGLARAGTPPRREAIDLEGLVDAVVEPWRAYAGERSVAVEAAADAAEITVDAGLMEVALRNVLTNAIDHSPAGGRVEVEARATADQVVVTIRDQGPGIPVALRGRIFEPFVRGDEAAADRRTARPGLGLGLAMTRRVLEGHGGAIEIDDSPGGGATFRLRWPRAQPPLLRSPPL